VYPAAVSVDPRIGTVVAGSRIEERLGPGGMSLVYRAEHATLGRKVAIKFLAPQLADDAASRERFLRESRLAAALHHPNIVPIFDAGEADGVPYITMHFVEGTDLAALLARHGPLATDRLLAIMAQVAGALDAAHDKGLVHRDVKPANILIASGEGVEAPGHVYLTDFGLAKQVAGVGTSITKQGLFMGTLDYIAPEQIQGLEVDRRTDVYSLGCVVYECLTGTTPYPRETEVATLYAHVQDPPPAVGERRPDLPPRVDAVMARALAKRADDRYPTCREVLQDLGTALDVIPAFGPVELPPFMSEPAAAEPTPVPAGPLLSDLISLDHRGSRYGLGRTATAYAVWSLQAGGSPVRLFPLTDEAWPEAWRAFHELEAATAEPAEEPAAGAAAEPPGGRPLTGAVYLDYPGRRYGLGRTQRDYAIWDVTAGGDPLETWPLRPEAWRDAWGRYQELEAAVASQPSPDAGPAPSAAAVPELVGAVAVDYRGRGYGLGRTQHEYAIWDLGAGGGPIRTFPLHPSSWPEAWAAFQELESPGPRG
jgi:tRNA A-37 threonylcarbamoyl transferase component Bud32